MPLALILSSHVAASRVGAAPVAHALTARKIDTLVVPTVLFGRHPGWGAPGGGAVAPETLAGMLEGIEAQGLFAQLDAALFGYFASAAQVEIAARTIENVRAVAPRALIAVDPIMGDDPGGLYVRPEVADAVAGLLVPRADLILPNLWELARLAGAPAASLGEAVAAARALGVPRALVSSVRDGATIGALYVDAEEAWAAFAPAEPRAPSGAGDLLAGAFLAARLEGLPAAQALHRAVGTVADVVRRANAWGAQELPLAAAQDAFIAPAVFARLAKA